ncbi:hypothetical protein [Streptomyces sp. SID3343]|uniref:hypothetical protein n=1 Tax=Streptomyces sp. SID3343 TaxID=2690260 RepID=UPI00136D16FB|nr:hypothetical protein [Streptomyces sp. SID3343]MYW00711.1 hypothetical protein [Streptomyces sp. SID3343]
MPKHLFPLVQQWTGDEVDELIRRVDTVLVRDERSGLEGQLLARDGQRVTLAKGVSTFRFRLDDLRVLVYVDEAPQEGDADVDVPRG